LDFDTETETWTTKMMVGDPSDPRSGYSACAVGDILHLYGGEGELHLNQDFYYYDVTKARWSLLQTLEWPPARKHACMICDFPRFYILGGVTINGYVSEVWEIDLQKLTVTLLSEDDGGGPDPFAFSNCFGEYVDDSFSIYIFTGEKSGEYPLEGAYQYDVQRNQWSEVGSPRIMSRVTAYTINDRFILAGGEQWGLYSFLEVYSTNLQTGSEELLANLPRKMYAGASA
jgi:N-acetylneuraminic acid mutarotase